MDILLARYNTEMVRSVLLILMGFVLCAIIFGQSGKKNSGAPSRPLIENVMDWAAYLGLLLGCGFWVVYWVDTLKPENVKGIMAFARVGLSFLFGVTQPLALPLLIAKVFPRDPFTLYFHEKTIETDAYKIMWATLAITGVVSFVMAWLWIGNSLGITDWLQRLLITFMFIALAVMVPSFAMLHVIPETWKLQLEIADRIEKKKKEAYVEQMLIEANLAQAIVIMSLDPLQMAADQRKENGQLVADLIGGVLIRVNESSRVIAKLAAHLARAQHFRIQTPEDQTIYDKLYELFLIERDEVVYQVNQPQQLQAAQPVMDIGQFVHANRSGSEVQTTQRGT